MPPHTLNPVHNTSTTTTDDATVLACLTSDFLSRILAPRFNRTIRYTKHRYEEAYRPTDVDPERLFEVEVDGTGAGAGAGRIIRYGATRFMDALAGLAASPEHGYNTRVACGLCVSEREVEVVLAGAGTQKDKGQRAGVGVEGRTIARITHIWDLLTSISRLPDADARHAAAKELRRRLVTLMLPRLREDFEGHLHKIKEWMGAIETARGYLYPQSVERMLDSGFIRRVGRVVRDVEGCCAKLNATVVERKSGAGRSRPSFKLEGRELDEVVESVLGLTRRVGVFLANYRKQLIKLDSTVVSTVELWTPKLMRKYQLVHHLEDLTQLPNHIRFLANFSTTPNMRSLATRELRITPLRCTQGSDAGVYNPVLPWPADKAAWQQRADDLLDWEGHRFCTPRERLVMARPEHDFSTLPCAPGELYVHPELEVTLHLARAMGTFYSGTAKSKSSSSQRRPLAYVGTSDYSCAACEWWLMSCNEQGFYPAEKEIFFRGSSEDWERDWLMPAVYRDRLVQSPLMPGVFTSSLEELMAWWIKESIWRFGDVMVEVKNVRRHQWYKGLWLD